ncbi:hypothetical protein [Mycobacterium colombiense]
MEWLHNHTVINALVGVTCVILANAIWARRWTLRPTTERLKLVERTMTVSLILQGPALFLASPASTMTVGWLLHAITGQWQLDTWAGHCLAISACALFALSIKARLFLNADEIRARFKRHFELPMTVAAPVMLALITRSPNADAEWADLFDSPTDHWLDAYWTILCMFVAYLLSRACGALLDLRLDLRNRRTATIYLCACAAGVAICCLRIISAWTDDEYSHYLWLAECAVSAAFAHGSARSWRQKVRWLSPRASL